MKISVFPGSAGALAGICRRGGGAPRAIFEAWNFFLQMVSI
jgi:hypothetical protein